MPRRIALVRVGGHPAADDLLQETLVRVLAALPRIEPPGPGAGNVLGNLVCAVTGL